MKKLAVIILYTCMLTSCRIKSGSGDIISETRNTGSFTGINVSGGFEVEIKKGESETVRVEADDNLIRHVETKVSGGRLNIRLEGINNLGDAHLKVFITAPEINEIKASASAEVKVMDDLRSDKGVEFDVSSGGEIETILEAPEVSAEASSGGELHLSGRTKNFRGECSSGASINAKELLSENSFVVASSGSSTSVHASVSLDAKASSGANISYRGAANVKKSLSSGGEVDREN